MKSKFCFFSLLCTTIKTINKTREIENVLEKYGALELFK